MSHRRSSRTWIWAAVTLQGAGLAYDGIWHGLLHPGFEARTIQEMTTHLATVHLPIYVGALSVLVATGWALVAPRRWPGLPLTMAFAGALLSVTGEAWHAYGHLQLSTHTAPIAGSLSPIGLLVVAVALWREGRAERGRTAAAVDRERRRAA
jgi:hypothetical protein